MWFRKPGAFLKRDLLESLSYRVPFLMDFFAILANTLIFFFIAKLFGGGASPYLGRYGGDYFPYVLIGIALAGYQSTALHSSALGIHRELGNGTLEAILLTPTRLSTVMISSSLWNFLFTSLRVIAYLLVGVCVFHVDLSHANFLAAALTLLLTMTSLSGLGIVSAGFILVFKRGDPVGQLMSGASRLLAGVYFPIDLLPHWSHRISFLIPLSHSLEAMRRAVLNGDGIWLLRSELTLLFGLSILLFPISLLFFGWAAQRAKKEGSLAFN